MSVGALFGGRALVVGAWAEGVPNKIVTVALGYDSQASRKLHDTQGIEPTIQGDIMKISNAQLGNLNFTRVVFQRCCPIVRAMGARHCGAAESYDPIDPSHLAHRLREIMAQTLPGWVFIRHCESVAHTNGIQSLETREKFIRIFESFGFELVKNFHLPNLLTHCDPGKDIPDPAPNCPDKWKPTNGALVFFKPPCS
jgi:hypothetical protein